LPPPSPMGHSLSSPVPSMPNQVRILQAVSGRPSLGSHGTVPHSPMSNGTRRCDESATSHWPWISLIRQYFPRSPILDPPNHPFRRARDSTPFQSPSREGGTNWTSNRMTMLCTDIKSNPRLGAGEANDFEFIGRRSSLGSAKILPSYSVSILELMLLRARKNRILWIMGPCSKPQTTRKLMCRSFSETTPTERVSRPRATLPKSTGFLMVPPIPHNFNLDVIATPVALNQLLHQ